MLSFLILHPKFPFPTLNSFHFHGGAASFLFDRFLALHRQLNLLRQGAGIGVVHDFARFAAPELQDILADEISFTRSFWLIRHADDVQVSRLNRFAVLLASGLKRTVSRLEGQR